MVTMVAGGPGRDSLHSAGGREGQAGLAIQEANCVMMMRMMLMMMTMMMKRFYIIKFKKKDKKGRTWCQSAFRGFNNR